MRPSRLGLVHFPETGDETASDMSEAEGCLLTPRPRGTSGEGLRPQGPLSASLGAGWHQNMEVA